MAEGLLTIGASASGSGLAAGMQKLMGGDESAGKSVDDYINEMNGRLTKYLKMSLDYSANQTSKAVTTQQNSLGQATGALNSALTGATNVAQNSLTSGFNQSQALQSPYALMGYNAADAYADSLGLARPAMGSASLAKQSEIAGTLDPQLIQQLQQAAQAAGQGAYSQGAAPTAPTDNRLSQAQLMSQFSPEQQAILNQQNLAGKAKMLNIANTNNHTKGQYGGQLKQAQQQLAQQQALQAQIQQQVNAQNSTYNTAQQQYQQQQGLFNNYSGAQQALLKSVQGISPEQLKTAMAYQNGIFNAPTRI